ncbi:PH domain-containing protein [Periweissella beninensis]|uniref:PH domain-containing protein n=1 Tax=Periweissella beninensis TaxID=504936 RepID=UPI0021A40441|nr:PH domain-containing protein [Periweissella beninensis]MCT4395669.1 hypothetical protein [Periweissella beninensis]
MQHSYQLPTSIKKAWLINRLISVLTTIITLLIILFIGNKYFANYLWVVWSFFTLLFIYEISLVVLIPYHYKFWCYQITDNYVYLQSGFFFRKHITIPLNRVQNVNLNQGPILRIFKLQAVEVVTAANNFTIDGITEKEADQLSKHIIRAARKAREENAYPSTSA